MITVLLKKASSIISDNSLLKGTKNSKYFFLQGIFFELFKIHLIHMRYSVYKVSFLNAAASLVVTLSVSLETVYIKTAPLFRLKWRPIKCRWSPFMLNEISYFWLLGHFYGFTHRGCLVTSKPFQTKILDSWTVISKFRLQFRFVVDLGIQPRTFKQIA